jgi:hypothetical protein
MPDRNVTITGPNVSVDITIPSVIAKVSQDGVNVKMDSSLWFPTPILAGALNYVVGDYFASDFIVRYT